ncbi:MAG: hypothetical protein ABJC39_12465 [Chloroflexota bacterium]
MASDAPSLAVWVWHLFAGDIVDPATLELMRPDDVIGFGREFDAESFGSDPGSSSNPPSARFLKAAAAS